MPWILVIEEDERHRRLPAIEGARLVGSGGDADLLLTHPTVSRRHAEVEPAEDGLWLVDLDSSNGTRVDGGRIASRTLVRAGQSIHFGSLRCHLEEADPQDLEPAVELPSSDASSKPVPASKTGTSGSEAAASTLSVGSVRDFVAVALPSLVTELERRRKALSKDDATSALEMRQRVVQAAGAALFESFPCLALEIVELPAPASDDEEEAVLFRAGPAQTGDAEWIQTRSGRLESRICFAPGLHVEGVLPLVELVTRLAALDLETSAGEPPDLAPRQPVVSPPAPASVDPGMRRLYDEARRVARGDIGVLISGESGTGKEVLARYVHACSPRAGDPWVALNCAALPQDLLEAELFGIERGVATGVEARAGRFEQANGGTLFLDEIGDMAPATQAKILRVLQEGEVYRLGAGAPRPAGVRVIAATNRDLPRMLEDGTFRLDLYHRIADCRLTLPPLRERLGDLPNLAAHFLARAAAEVHLEARGISKAALEALLAFSWPGNLRQLEREMARAALFLEDGELLQRRHLPPEIAGDGAQASPADRTLEARLASYERGILTECLIRHDRNVRAAAEELGVGRTTLYRRIQVLGVEI